MTKPTIESGDEVFFHHPKLGPHHGKVKTQGADGCVVVDTENNKHRVPWSNYLGLKKRAKTRFKVVTQGEDGAILEANDGRREFVAGWNSPKTTDPGEDEVIEDQMRDLEATVQSATKRKKKKNSDMTKSFAASSSRVVFFRY